MTADYLSLCELQAQFSDYVLHDEQNIKTQIVNSTELKSDVRLAIYANAYVARLVEALETDYATLKLVMGEADFQSLAEGYIVSNPSTYTSLRWFGQHLPRFIESSAIFSAKGHIIELAHLEWKLATAFNALDADVVTESDVAQVPPDAWPSLSLLFHPSVQLMDYYWNIIHLWHCAKKAEAIPEAVKFSELSICVIWRDKLKTLFRTAESEEASVLPAMLQGATFGDLCEMLSENSQQPDQVPMQAAGYLKTWINAGMVSRLNFSTDHNNNQLA